MQPARYLALVILLATTACALESSNKPIGDPLGQQPINHAKQETVLKDMLNVSTPPARDSVAAILEPLAKQSRLVSNQLDSNQKQANQQPPINVQSSMRSLEPEVPSSEMHNGALLTDARALVSTFKNGQWVEEPTSQLQTGRSIVTAPSAISHEGGISVMDKVAESLFGQTNGKKYLTNGDLSLSLDSDGHGFFTIADGYPSRMRCSMDPKDWDREGRPTIGYSSSTRELAGPVEIAEEETSPATKAGIKGESKGQGTGLSALGSLGGDKFSSWVKGLPGLSSLEKSSKASVDSNKAKSLKLRNSKLLLKIFELLAKLGLDEKYLKGENNFLAKVLSFIRGYMEKLHIG